MKVVWWLMFSLPLNAFALPCSRYLLSAESLRQGWNLVLHNGALTHIARPIDLWTPGFSLAAVNKLDVVYSGTDLHFFVHLVRAANGTPLELISGIARAPEAFNYFLGLHLEPAF